MAEANHTTTDRHDASTCPRAPAIRATTRSEYHEQHCTRPDDCECWGQDDLACFECFRAGFETPNPNAEGDR